MERKGSLGGPSRRAEAGWAWMLGRVFMMTLALVAALGLFSGRPSSRALDILPEHTEAHRAAIMAANPELNLSRGFMSPLIRGAAADSARYVAMARYFASQSRVAANPELSSFDRWAFGVAQSDLAANPELSAARRKLGR